MSTQTFDDRSSDFIYSGSWFLQGTWTASNGQSGTLSSTNDQTASVQFTFPVAATAFRYFGMKRSHGGLYGICVDCDPNNPSFTTINAFDPTDNGENPPSLLFQKTFSSPSVHVIIIHNEADPNGTPTGNSQLTLDRFELDVPAPANTITTTVQVQKTNTVNAPTQPPSGNGGGTGNAAPSTQVATTTEAIPATISSGSQVSSTTMSATTVSFSNTTTLAPSGAMTGRISQSQSGPVSASSALSSTPVADGSGATNTSVSVAPTAVNSHPSLLGPIIGGAVGGLAIVAFLVVLMFWLRVRKQASSGTLTTISEQSGRSMSEQATTVSPVPTASAGGGWVTGYGFSTFEKGGHRNHIASPTSPLSELSTSSNAHTTTSGSNSTLQSPPRAVDAGPVPPHLLASNIDNETLPPDYRQIFTDRLSDRASQFLRRTARSPVPPLPTTSISTTLPPLATSGSALPTLAVQPVRRS